MIVFSASFSNAQQNVFTEEAFLAAVKRYHPVARQALVNIEIAKADVLSSRGWFDPALSAGAGNKEFDGITYYNQRTVELKVPTWYGS